MTAGVVGCDDPGDFGATGSVDGAGSDRSDRVAGADVLSFSLRLTGRLALATFGSLAAFDDAVGAGEVVERDTACGGEVESPSLRTTLLDEFVEGEVLVELVEPLFPFAELLSPRE
ncbi:MAG: hypothetical protein U1A77_17645 [Pirellulales bacterium]